MLLFKTKCYVNLPDNHTDAKYLNLADCEMDTRINLII